MYADKSGKVTQQSAVPVLPSRRQNMLISWFLFSVITSIS